MFSFMTVPDRFQTNSMASAVARPRLAVSVFDW